MSKLGRPQKVTPDLEERIVAFLREGGLAHDAANSCGISGMTYYRHRKRNAAFARAADKAQADAWLEAAAHVAKSNPAFYLSRTDREHWGPHLRVTTQNAAPETCFIVIHYDAPNPAPHWPAPVQEAAATAIAAEDAYRRDPTDGNRRAKNAAKLDYMDQVDAWCGEERARRGIVDGENR